MKTRLLLLGSFLLLSCATLFAQATDDKGRELGKAVWKASGGENWPKVKELQFTFIVEQDGKQLSAAQHHWTMSPETDHVKWKDKDVTVNLASPGDDENAKAAFARWTNDSYWLLAPLKLLDPGVNLSYEGMKETDGAQYETLRVSFDKVGLTPGDNYVLYIDPETKLVRAWDYMPKADTVMHGSWEKYQDFGGLKLATEHNFAGKMIRFADVKVVQ